MRKGLIIETSPLDVFRQMAADEYYCVKMPAVYILRFYNWGRRGITFGYSQRYSLAEKAAESEGKKNWDMARRPTGGGIVYHEKDLTFSFIFPHPGEIFNPEGVYTRIHRAILSHYRLEGAVFEILGEKKENYDTNSPFMDCFRKPVPHDIMEKGRKVLGGALRKFQGHMLYQASFQSDTARKEENFHRRNIAKSLANEFNIIWEVEEAGAEEMAEIEKIAKEKYSAEEWNRRI